MTVKGYYPSLSLGFEILLGCVNVIAGTGLLAFALVILFNKIVQLMGLALLALLGVPIGILAITAGALALNGSCRESVPTVKAAFILSSITLLCIGGLVAYTFATANSLPQSGRKTWFSLDDKDKQIIQSNYACCGFNSLNEKTADCEPEITCGEPLVTDLGSKLKILVIMGAVVGGVQLGAILCGCCVWGKMRSQQEKKKRKNPLSLAEEARGGYKSKTSRKKSSGK